MQGWQNVPPADAKIRLYPDGKPDAAWNWELWLDGKKIAAGKSPGTQEIAFGAPRQALAKARERRSNRTDKATRTTP
jgi:hypothetical protein